MFRVTGHLCGESTGRRCPAQRSVTQSFGVFFDQCLNKRLSKQSWGWGLEMPSRPLWRHCKAVQVRYYCSLVCGNVTESTGVFTGFLLVCDLNRTPIVMAKHGGPCVHFSGISTFGRTSRETVSHPQHQPLPTLCKISLPVYVIVTNERLQPLTTTWYHSLVLYFSLLKI